MGCTESSGRIVEVTKTSTEFDRILALALDPEDKKFKKMVNDLKDVGVIVGLVRYLLHEDGASDHLQRTLSRIVAVAENTPLIGELYTEITRICFELKTRIYAETIIRSDFGRYFLHRLDSYFYPHPYVIDVFETAKSLGDSEIFDLIFRYNIKYNIDVKAFKDAYKFLHAFDFRLRDYITVGMRTQFNNLGTSGQTDLLRILIFGGKKSYSSLIYDMIFEAKIDIPEYPVLHHLVRKNLIGPIQSYVKHGCDLSVRDSAGNYAYSIARSTMDEKLYKQLIPNTF